MGWRFDIATHIGGRAQQQDRVQVLGAAGGREFLVVLADGMGGHREGAAAAQTVVDVARREFDPRAIGNPRLFLESLCVASHAQIHRLAKDKAAAPGSTCVLLYLKQAEAYWMHVGDSRLYHFRNGRMLFRTQDHRMDALAPTGALGGLPKAHLEGAGDQLYMCLGGHNRLAPEFGASALTQDDWFLICSDGFWSAFSELELARLAGDVGGRITAQALVETAGQRVGAGSDNLSLVLAHCASSNPVARLFRRLKSGGG